MPGECGCEVLDVDSNGDTVPDCKEQCSKDADCEAPEHATAWCERHVCTFTCNEGYRATEDKTGCELITVCHAGEKRCTDKSVETCAEDGSEWTVTDTCEETESCNAATFECEVPSPGACQADGVGFIPNGSTVCKDGKTYACADGEVTETACEAPEHAMATCEENACAFTCAGDYVLSEDKKSCVEKPCDEGATKCKIVGEAPMMSTCEDGAWKEATECPAPANATAICTTDKIKCDFTCGEGYTKVEASEGVEAACQKDVPPAPQSCDVEGSTIANGETKCIGSSLYACADGIATPTACTTDVAHATAVCNADETACTVQCNEGYDAKGEGEALTCEESVEPSACTEDVCAVTDGVATLQRCMPSFGALTEPEPCSALSNADANAIYGCNTKKTACAITSCKDGYELTDGACVEKKPTCTDTEGLVGEVGQTYEFEWIGCNKDKTAIFTCGPHYDENGYVFSTWKPCDAGTFCNPETVATSFGCEELPPGACQADGVGFIPNGSTVCKNSKTYACADGVVTTTVCTTAVAHATAVCNTEMTACTAECIAGYEGSWGIR